MSFTFYPSLEKDLIVPNIDEFKLFLNECHKNNNYNVGIYGSESSCKTTLCNYFMDCFIRRKIKDNFENSVNETIELYKSKMIFIYESEDDLNINNIQSRINIFCKKINYFIKNDYKILRQKIINAKFLSNGSENASNFILKELK